MLKYPNEFGTISDWDHMERLWNHAIKDKLNANPKESYVLLSEGPFNKQERHAKCERMFEKCGVAGLYLEMDALSVMRAHGETTGCVLDSGHGVTTCVPVVDGAINPKAVNRWMFGGRDVTADLIKLLQEGAWPGASHKAEIEVFDDMKKEMFTWLSTQAQRRPGRRATRSLVDQTSN